MNISFALFLTFSLFINLLRHSKFPTINQKVYIKSLTWEIQNYWPKSWPKGTPYIKKTSCSKQTWDNGLDALHKRPRKNSVSQVIQHRRKEEQKPIIYQKTDKNWVFNKTATWLPHGQLWYTIPGDSLAQPMLVTLIYFRPEGHGEPGNDRSYQQICAGINEILNIISTNINETTSPILQKD